MKDKLSLDEAQQIAIAALGFIAAQPDLLSRFLALTGIAAADIRQAASESGFLAGVLQFLCANESDLLDFCQFANIQPEQISTVLHLLPGGYQEDLI